MSDLDRRQFLTAAAAVPAYVVHAAPAASPARIRIGQIGTGHAHASGKMESIRKLADLYEVVGVVEPDPRRRQAAEGHKAYQGLKWMDERELLNAPGLAAVAVETEVRDLVPTAQRCAEAGLFIHLDKPAGESLPAYRQLLRTASAAKRIVQMGYMLRYNPGIRLACQAAAEGWLGQVFSLHAEMSKRQDAGRDALARYPGGILFELGCHVLDSAVKVLGKPLSVKSVIQRTRFRDDDLADNMLAVLEYPKASATIRSSLIDYAGGSRRQFVVGGTEGTIAIMPLEPPEAVLTLSQARGPYKKGEQRPTLAKTTGRYDEEFRDLAAVIRGEKAFEWTVEHDLTVHETLLRASGLPVD
jgi:predicted dehydrogenase